MPKFNTRQFERDVAKQMASKQMQRTAFSTVQARVNEARQELIRDFEDHPVTREIEGGTESSNLSGTLGGYGNLFTFIGFSAGSNPTSQIRKYLLRTARVFRQPKRVDRKQRHVDMVFSMDTPMKEDIESLTPSPWSGKSWTREVERGISGFGFYMYSNDGVTDSRSGKAVQASNKLRSLAYKPVKYMSDILDKFYSKLG